MLHSMQRQLENPTDQIMVGLCHFDDRLEAAFRADAGKHKDGCANKDDPGGDESEGREEELKV